MYVISLLLIIIMFLMFIALIFALPYIDKKISEEK
jgi:hypothetical protein